MYISFQEVLNILYFKIIPTISQNFDSNFWGPKLTHTLYSPLILKNLVRITCIFQIKLELLFFCFHYVNSNILVILLISCVYIVCHLGHSLPNAALHQTGPRVHQTPTPVVSGWEIHESRWTGQFLLHLWLAHVKSSLIY